MCPVKSIFDIFSVTIPKIATCLFIAVCVCLQAACKLPATNVDEPQPINTEVNVQKEMSVKLTDIDPPEFGKLFAILYAEKDATNVYWGYVENSIVDACFMTNSSYPGFGYTVMLQDDYFSQQDSVTLSTKYGEYNYTFVSSYEVFDENGELKNHGTGERVNRLDPDTERLSIYSSVSNVVYDYVLKKGTKIQN